MCGIAGWIDWQNDEVNQREILTNMMKKLHSRGPDESGMWVSQQAGLVHRRLVVVDPVGGKQPMIKTMGDRSYIITYNGELYNTMELQRRLEAKGFHFLGHSDTEVLLTAYILWKEKCLDFLNGIFALGIWDEKEQELFLARDRLGVKPLFYTKCGSGFLFASEIKALLVHPEIKPEIKEEGIAEIFLLGPARTPGHGIYNGINELRPGHYLLYKNRCSTIKKYWSLKSYPHEEDFESTCDHTGELLKDSIRRQMISDVPVCTFLSGGLDSSIISAVALEYVKQIGKDNLNTYSIDYVDNTKYFKSGLFQPDSDTEWAKSVASFLGTQHHNILIDTPQLVSALKAATLARDLPGMADIDSSLYLFCTEVKKDATVALSGECADEIFGGYPWFYRKDLMNADSEFFPWTRSIFERIDILAPGILNNVNGAEYVRQRYRDTLREVPYLFGENKEEHRHREMMYLNLNWFMTTLLDRKDRMSMATGLEVRVPFCDHRMVEYAWNIPWTMKFYKDREKGLLRQAFKGVLPEDVLWRKKSPYPKTFNPNYLEAVKNLLSGILDDSSSPLLQLIDKTKVKKIVESDGATFGKPWFGQLMTSAQIFAYLIQVDIWLKEYKVILSV